MPEVENTDIGYGSELENGGALSVTQQGMSAMQPRLNISSVRNNVGSILASFLPLSNDGTFWPADCG